MLQFHQFFIMVGQHTNLEEGEGGWLIPPGFTKVTDLLCQQECLALQLVWLGMVHHNSLSWFIQ